VSRNDEVDNIISKLNDEYYVCAKSNRIYHVVIITNEVPDNWRYYAVNTICNKQILQIESTWKPSFEDKPYVFDKNVFCSRCRKRVEKYPIRYGFELITEPDDPDPNNLIYKPR
jgi:hypothetical protein